MKNKKTKTNFRIYKKIIEKNKSIKKLKFIKQKLFTKK